jgi:hypothetical protein
MWTIINKKAKKKKQEIFRKIDFPLSKHCFSLAPSSFVISRKQKRKCLHIKIWFISLTFQYKSPRCSVNKETVPVADTVCDNID